MAMCAPTGPPKYPKIPWVPWFRTSCSHICSPVTTAKIWHQSPLLDAPTCTLAVKHFKHSLQLKRSMFCLKISKTNMGLFENEANGSSSFSLILNNTALDTFGVYNPIADRPWILEWYYDVLYVTDILVKSFGIVGCNLTQEPRLGCSSLCRLTEPSDVGTGKGLGKNGQATRWNQA